MKIRYCIATLNQFQWVLDRHLPSVDQTLIDGIHLIVSENFEQRYNNQKTGDVFNVAEFSFFVDSADVPVRVSQHEGNLGVAPSWNEFISAARQDGYDAVIIANDDIILYQGALAAFVSALRDNPFVCFADEHNMFSFFGMHLSLVDTVGTFDEKFWPAYYEDNDYHYRMKLLGVPVVSLPPPSYFHQGSATIHAFDEDRKRMHHHNFRKNTIYYVSKWGGLPDAESFTRPFGGAKDDGYAAYQSRQEQLERDFQTFARSGEEI